MRLLICIAACTLLMVNCSCTQGGGSLPGGPLGQLPGAAPKGGPAAAAATHQPLPGPAELLARLDAARAGSFSPAEGYKDASDYAAALPSAGVSVNGFELQFSPQPGLGGLGGAAYAIWDFTLPTPDSGLLISLLWEVPPGAGQAWLALGNFSTSRWDWQRLDNLDAASIADAAAYYGPGDRLLLAVAVSDAPDASLRSIQLYAGQPPSAVLLLTPEAVDAGDEVLMDGSASSDLEGAIVRYEWDSDGDGSFEADSGALSSYSAYPSQPGSFSLGLRVTDASGQTAVATQPLTVQAFNAPQTLDDATPSGLYTSMAVVNGLPAICYLDSSTTAALRFVRALDADGSAWGEPITVDAAGTPGFYNSMLIVNGNPAISYCALTDVDLRYVRASDADGGAWGAPVPLDVTGFTGFYTSMCIVSGVPAVSYYDTDNGNLRYILAQDVNGAGWNLGQTIDSDGVTGEYPSLRVVAGNPAVSYRDSSQGELCFIRSSDTIGANWDLPRVLDSSGSPGYWTSLEIIDGKPAIAYHDGDTGDLRFIRSQDSEGSAWSGVQTLDPGYSTSDGISLAVIRGKPALGYYADGVLRYIRALDASGSSWAGAQTLDSAAPTGLYVSLVEVNGQAALSYQDNAGGLLRFVRGN